jgi:hypothetical protein
MFSALVASSKSCCATGPELWMHNVIASGNNFNVWHVEVDARTITILCQHLHFPQPVSPISANITVRAHQRLLSICAQTHLYQYLQQHYKSI